MPTIDYKPIANGVGANVVSQGQYLTDLAPGGSLETGYVSGTAQSNQVNKTVRQSSVMTAAVATFISNQLITDVLDDGNVTALTALVLAAIQSAALQAAWSTGDVKLTMKTAADAGWVLCNDGTIGDASSGGTTRANADCQALFTLLWTNVSNTWAPVSGGRGGSAAADWAAHKTISLTKTLGRALAISGAGSGLSARALGQTTGAETVVLDTTMIPAHGHGVTDGGHAHGITDPGHIHSTIPTGPVSGTTGFPLSGTPVTAQDTGSSTTGISVNAATTGIAIQDTGGGAAHANMQPTSFLNAMIKL